jgi:hypothetical protein
MTSSRSSIAGATLAFTMTLASPALRGLPLALTQLLCERSAMAWAICCLDSGGLRLLPASGLADGSSIGKRWPSNSAFVQPPLGDSLSFVLVE